MYNFKFFDEDHINEVFCNQKIKNIELQRNPFGRDNVYKVWFDTEEEAEEMAVRSGTIKYRGRGKIIYNIDVQKVTTDNALCLEFFNVRVTADQVINDTHPLTGEKLFPNLFAIELIQRGKKGDRQNTRKFVLDFLTHKDADHTMNQWLNGGIREVEG